MLPFTVTFASLKATQQTNLLLRSDQAEAFAEPS